ncbi:hypothetical protein FA10DRAFT_285751 [Acaromyces ingoldii]|uniref:Uncharacterized protein n=1 Tax=Acaromyces ingoldii TaxID=215250 RepID=A0A316YLC5_9BASI|nr:hypothetical protein FA10DRAFT_285751 [Acaromyces ingoldii]PWN90039.1 hypothetical protein FA10DRAFT_285751 [Acaromyces ingoldii]
MATATAQRSRGLSASSSTAEAGPSSRLALNVPAAAGASSPSASSSSPLAYASMVDDRRQAQRLLSTMALEDGPMRLQRSKSLKKNGNVTSRRRRDVAAGVAISVEEAQSVRSRRTESLKRPIILPDPRQAASMSQNRSNRLAVVDRNHSPILDGDDDILVDRDELWSYASDGCRQDKVSSAKPRSRTRQRTRPTSEEAKSRTALPSLPVSVEKHWYAEDDGQRRQSSYAPGGVDAHVGGEEEQHEGRTRHRSGSSSLSIPSLLRRPSRSSVASAMSSQHLAALVSRPSASVPTDSSPSINARSAATLYNLSRGRSTHVSPSRRWDRRGASASVLSGTDSAGDEEAVVRDEPSARIRQLSASEQVKIRAAKLAESRHSSSPTPQSTSKARWQQSRRTSAGSLDMALFSSEDGISSSSDDELHPSSSSRRSSMDKEKRRGLRVLLAPSYERDDGEATLGARVGSCATSLTSEEVLSDERNSLASSCSSSTTDFLEFGTRRGVRRDEREDSDEGKRARRQDMADDESDGTIGTSALLIRRRSRSGKRLLRSTLRSPTSPSRAAPRMSAITSGLTPASEETVDLTPTASGFSDATTVGSSSRPPTTLLSQSQESSQSITSVPVEQDADPLLSSGFGSVADLINVDAVVWTDLSRRGSAATNLLSIAAQRDVEEQEKARRSGFAVAYQERLASLSTQLRLWSRPAPASPSEETVLGTGVATPLASDNLSSSGKARDPLNEQTQQAHQAQQAEQVRATVEQETTPTSESLFSSSWRHLSRLPNLLQLPALSSSSAKTITQTPLSPSMEQDARPSSPSNASSRSVPSASSSPGPSSRSLSDKAKGRGVMNPLEGDADVSAYVSGLGMPIDPDVELSSVVHLQTFRSRSKSVGPPPLISAKQSFQPRLDTASEDESPPDQRRHRRTASDWGPTESLSKFRAPRRPERQSKQGSTPRLSSADQEGGAAALSSKLAAARRLSPPRCSRPAVQAPVPGNFSAYNSSASGSEDSESERSSLAEKRRRRSDDEGENDDRTSRGQRSGTNSRRSSPPSSSRQCAIGLFSSGPTTRRREMSQASIVEVVEEHQDGVQMIRVKSLPNLCSNGRSAVSASARGAHKTSSVSQRGAASSRRGQTELETRKSDQDQSRILEEAEASKEDDSEDVRGRTGGRGRVGSVKVVSASLGPSMSPSGESPAPLSMSMPSTPSPFGGNLMGSSAMVMGSSGVGANSGIRPSMVSNGAHLLMLSLELEMMRSRKITCSLKPRWLKARARPERASAPGTPLDELDKEPVASPPISPPSGHLQYLASKPRSSSNLRFELG